MSEFADALNTVAPPEASDFSAIPLDNAGSPVSAPVNGMTAQISAAAQVKSLSDIQNTTIDTARKQLTDGQEASVRLQVAAQRQQRQMEAVNRNREAFQSEFQTVSEDTKAKADEIYGNIAAQNLEEASKTSIERQAIENIHDDMTVGNTVEAKLTNDLVFGRGSATKQWYDAATKNLLLAQKMQEFSGEAEDASYLRTAANFVTGLLPTNYNFSRNGIIPDSGTGIMDFFLPGNALAKQSDKFRENMRDSSPEAFADALKQGGSIDTAIRSNSTTAGIYDPSLATDLLKNISYIDNSDRLWANAWGAVDVAGVLPWSKIASIPKALVNLGSRSAANRLAANAFEDVIANGAEGAAQRTGVSAPEVVEHLELSTMTPSASNPHSVPLSVDVSARMEAVEKLRAALPEKLQVSRETNPAELASAHEAALKEIQATTGRSIKDHRFMYEDLEKGQNFEYKPGSPLPEQGNVVHYVEVTFGKKSGGGYARAKTAVSDLFNKIGIRSEAVQEGSSREIRIPDPDFEYTGFHGTGEHFDVHDLSRGGQLTDAQSAKEGIFYVSDPDVAWTYARGAATDRARSLPEYQKIVKDYNEARTAWVENPGLNEAEYAAAEKKMNDLNSKRIQFNVGNDGIIRPAKIKMKNPYIYDFDENLSNGYEEGLYTRIIQEAKAAGHDGVILKNTEDSHGVNPRILEQLPLSKEQAASFNKHDVFVVFDPENVKAPWDAVTLAKDTSGQWFGKARFNISETGFLTTPMNTPDTGWFGGFVKNASNKLDRDTHYKAVAAGSSANTLDTAIKHLVKDALKGVGSVERQNLDAIIRKGQNVGKWLDDTQFDMVYERIAVSGNLPTEAVRNAYRTYQTANDLEFFLRRNEIYKAKAIRGVEGVKLTLGKSGIVFDGEGTVKAGSRPTNRVFDATTGEHYNSANPLTQKKFDRLLGEGYVHVKLEEGVKFPDGLRISDVIVHRSELERSALDVEKQLFYKEGGHRAYTGRNFVKQTVRGKQPDNGSEYLDNPNVFRTSNNPNKLRAWADIFNKAIDDAASGITDPQHFDDNVFANTKGLSFPTGEDFLQSVKDGKVSLADHVEVVGDREMPKAYNEAAPDVERFMDDESSIGGYYRTTGRMYTSSKGKPLLDESGEFAETIDPWETTNTALQNISRLSSFSNYKENALQRFKATFGSYLESKTDSPADLIRAPIKRGTDVDLARKIKAEQSAVGHIMNFETDWERNVKHSTRKLADWILGDAEGGARLMAHDAFYWLSKNNPVNFIRGLSFDAKLGFFNPGQFLLQSSTMLASTALSPLHGGKGMLSAVPLITFVTSKGSEAVLDKLAKNGAWKIGGFATEQEFKDYARLVHKTGFLDVGSSHLSINDLGANRVFGAAGKADAFREAGRTFFYHAEKMNRSVSTRIAYEELKAQGLQVGTAEFREKFVGLADDYSFNMTGESSANFQRGLWSIPTQFWGYNVRMMEAMFGPRFTATQKARLIASQTLLWGVAGVPVAESINEYVKASGNGESPATGSIDSMIDRGLFDNAIAAVTGADVRVGERIGTGTFLTNTVNDSGAFVPANAVIQTVTGGLVKDFFSGPKYGKSPTPMEFFGGATGSIGGQGITAAGSALGSAYRYATAEKGDAELPLLKEDFIKFAENVSTLSNFHKGYLVNQYGYYRSAAGTVQAEVPTADAMWVAMGLGRPQELDQAETMKAFIDNKDKVVKEGATMMRNWRQEAGVNPDLAEENAKKAQTYINLLPPDVAQKVLKQTNSLTDNTFYEHIATKYEKEKSLAESNRPAQ